MFSAIQDQQSREMSQGKLASKAKRMRVTQEDLKLPRVTAMDACQVCPSAFLLQPSHLCAVAAVTTAVAVAAVSIALAVASAGAAAAAAVVTLVAAAAMLLFQA